VAGRPKRVEIYARLDEAFVELRERLVVSPIQLRRRHLDDHLVRGGAQLDRPRRQHPCPKAGRDATSRG